MTPAEFKAWRKRLGFTQQQAGDAIGKDKRTIISYEKGIESHGRPAPVPLTVELACKWLEQQWRPIESAPKDGSWVLVGGGGWDVTQAWYAMNPRIGKSYWKLDEEWDDYELAEVQPTHWQPLPQPPEE